ncbi:MAG: type II secretion system protein [Phycisphaerales bacterium JB050]
MNPRNTRRSAGFTLVELLVVIAVLALLVGVLLPALSGARRSAQAVQCLSQMRTLGQFTSVYAGENRGHMPRSQHSAFPNRVPPWGYAFYAYITGSEYRQGAEDWLEVFNNDYRCPLDERSQGWSYGYNVYFELTAAETQGRTWDRISDAPRPSLTVLFCEIGELTTADHAMAHFWTLFNAPPEVDRERHRPGSAAVFLDGHAEERPFSQFFDQTDHIDTFNPLTAR